MFPHQSIELPVSMRLPQTAPALVKQAVHFELYVVGGALKLHGRSFSSCSGINRAHLELLHCPGADKWSLRKCTLLKLRH
jgi:hypothetical protein